MLPSVTLSGIALSDFFLNWNDDLNNGDQNPEDDQQMNELADDFIYSYGLQDQVTKDQLIEDYRKRL